VEASVVPPSDGSGERGDSPVDALAPLRASAGAPGQTWRQRAQVTADQIRGGGPTRWLAVVIVVLAVAAIGGGAVVVGSSSASSQPGAAPSLPFAHGAGTTVDGGSKGGTSGGSGSSGNPGSPSGTAKPELVVQAAGAVVRPGVYRLVSGSRVVDLVAAAGGLTADADADRVNLASPLSDGARVYLPRRGETIPLGPVSDGGSTGGAASSPSTLAPPLDLNTATVAQLDTLPGVGPATAAAIIDHRQRHGPFRSVDELAQVRGIGAAKLAQLRDLVHV
jgi:competence protein ComEA